MDWDWRNEKNQKTMHSRIHPLESHSESPWLSEEMLEDSKSLEPQSHSPVHWDNRSAGIDESALRTLRLVALPCLSTTKHESQYYPKPEIGKEK